MAKDITSVIESLGCSVSYAKPSVRVLLQMHLVTEVKDTEKVLHLTMLKNHALTQVAT